MKKLFIYYSLSGNGDIIADYLKDKNYEIRKIEAKKGLPNNMFLRILTGGFLAGINHKTPIKYFDSNIDSYDEILIGSPIWNDHLSCPINTVLEKLNLTNKKITFILYSGSGEAKKTEIKLKETYREAKIIILKEPKKNKNIVLEILSKI